MHHSAKAEAVRQAVQRLIESGSTYDAEALDRIYHEDLRIIKIDKHDRVTSIGRTENMGFFGSKRESGAEALSHDADRLDKSVFSIRLV